MQSLKRNQVSKDTSVRQRIRTQGSPIIALKQVNTKNIPIKLRVCPFSSNLSNLYHFEGHHFEGHHFKGHHFEYIGRKKPRGEVLFTK